MTRGVLSFSPNIIFHGWFVSFNAIERRGTQKRGLPFSTPRIIFFGWRLYMTLLWLLLLLLLWWILRVIAPAIVIIIIMLIHDNFCTCFHNGVPSPTENWGYGIEGQKQRFSLLLKNSPCSTQLGCLRVSAPLSPHTHLSINTTWRGIHDSTQWNKSLQILVIQYKHRCLFQRLHFLKSLKKCLKRISISLVGLDMYMRLGVPLFWSKTKLS